MAKLNLSTSEPSTAPPPRSTWLSPQQHAVLDFIEQPDAGNAIIEAVAGAGKTSTLIEVCKYLQGSVVFCAFNKKIADEIGYKLLAAGAPKSIKAATFHSLGFSAWRRVAPNVRVDAEKQTAVMAKLGLPKNMQSFVASLVSLARQRAFGCGEGFPTGSWSDYRDTVDHFDLQEKLYSDDEYFSADAEEERIDLGIDWAQRVLHESSEMATELIDFDDMIYMPLLRHATFWRNQWVLIDEAQDTNPARRALAHAMLAPGGRLIAVGDPRQAIYGFTGADADALDLIARDFSCTTLPLTVSFRCAQTVVKHARRWVSHIEPAPDAPLGAVVEISHNEFMRVTPRPQDAILCRVTRPLIELAFMYLRKMIPAHVEGRDIGKALITLSKKWRSVKTVGDLQSRLEDYLVTESQKLHERGQNAKAAQLADRVTSLFAIMENLKADDPVIEVERIIDRIFKDTEGKPVQSITLSTVHKAKGREWERVFLFGRDAYMPHPFAKQLWEIGQEQNLIYVAVTRAKRELIEVALGTRG